MVQKNFIWYSKLIPDLFPVVSSTIRSKPGQATKTGGPV